MRGRFLGSWLGVGLLAALAAACSGPDYETLARQAQAALDAGDTERAWQLAVAAQSRAPGRMEAYRTIIPLAQNHGRAADAVPLLEQRVALGGEGLAGFQLVLGQLLLEVERRRDAERSFREAIRLQPDSTQAYLALTAVLGVEQRNDEAVKLMLEAPPAVAEDPTIRTRAAALLSRLGRWDEAREILIELVRADPGNAPAQFFRAIVHLHDDESARARDALRMAVDRSPDFTLAWYQLANAHERLGELEQRDEAMRRFVDLYREHGVRGGAAR